MNASHDQAVHGKPFQFGLRTMLLGVTLVGMLLAVMVHVQPVWSLVLCWSLLLIAAHVMANAWGTRSRACLPAPPAPDDVAHGVRNVPIEYAPATRLRRISRLTPSMLCTAVVGAAVGAVVGTMTVINAYHGAVGYLGTTIASTSGATLGAVLGFLASSFLGVTVRALREAASEPR